jgi:type IV pilus assembly protein PilM
MYDYCYPTVEEEIVALVNVGATTININILHNACSKYTRDLPVGGYTITKEIMRFFDVDYRQAENIKRGAQIDSKITPRNLRKIFQRAVDNFVSEIQKIFDFFSTNISYDPIQKIFLSGGAAATYGLESALASELSIPVEIVNPFRNLKVNPKMFDQMYLEEIGPQMAVAVGLALRDERDKEGPWSR